MGKEKVSAAEASTRGVPKEPYTSGDSTLAGGDSGDPPPAESAPRKDRATSKRVSPRWTGKGKTGKAVGEHGVPGSRNPERRCHATSVKTGEQCKRAAIKGGTVCTTHGGASPQVRKAAKERLLDLVEPAINELAKLLNRKDVDDSVKLRAIQLLLDRTGYGPGADIKLEVTKWDQMFITGDFLEVDRTLDATSDGGGEVIEGEVIES